MNVNKLREDFPILQKDKPNPQKTIYFDNACMSLKPRQVIEKISEYYNEYPACVGRSNHSLGARASEEYNNARRAVQKLLNAKDEHQIIFLRNTTEAINLVSRSLAFDTVITTDKEHNSNLIPWLNLKSKKEIVKTDSGFDMKSFEEILRNNKDRRILVSMAHTSNMDGTSIPARDIIKLSHEYGAIVMLDGAQSVPHKNTDVKKLDVDLLAFSGHKMLGPTGTGILYGKKELLETFKPYNVGGDTVKDSTYESFELEEIPERFEAGLQDYAGFIGLGEAAKYLGKYISDIEDQEQKLNRIMTEGLSEHIDILGPHDYRLRGGILSFNARNKMPYHEISSLLSSYAQIMIRSGRHCVHSWFNAHKIDGSARASVYLYNTEEEARLFVEKLKEILKMRK